MTDGIARVIYGDDGAAGYEEKVGQKTSALSLPVTVASDQSTLPISAASLPLPAGAATESTLAAQSAKLPATLGQKAMAASISVAMASNQSGIDTQARQDVQASVSNDSTANLAAGASFTGTGESTLGVAGIQVNIIADQPILLQLQQSTDNTNWDFSDDQTFLATEGDSRTFQATASYFRVIATNLGPATTTYFRLQVALCPVVEALPRALTLGGHLSLSAQLTGFTPDPTAYINRASHRALLLDTEQNLQIRGRVLTDESSFRDDFADGARYTDLTGTCYFTNGSRVVTGVGTAFLSELNLEHYLRLSSHALNTAGLVGELISDTFFYLDEPYTGATASGTGRSSFWTYTEDAGATITQAGSEILLASGVTSGAKAEANRGGDYLPYSFGFRTRITQRIANQLAHIGLGDDHYATADNQAYVVFAGTDNTKVTLRTSSSASDVEETTVTLPNGLVSSTSIFYQMEITAGNVTLYADDVEIAQHRLHIPGPYSEMYCHASIWNTGIAASTTTLALDTFFLSNFNRLEVANTLRGSPLSTKEQRASSSVGTNISAAVADTALLAANPNRLGAMVYNDSVATLYLKLGVGASPTSYTIALGRYDYYEIPNGFTGRIYGYWSAATGTARVTELT